MKAEKKAKKNWSGDINLPSPLSVPEKTYNSEDEVNCNDVDAVKIQIKDTIGLAKRKETSWTVSGKEAEALHMEEEDGEGNSEDEIKDPLQKLLQSG